MQGPIAQTLGLAIYANAFLQGRDIADFWPDAAFFQFCRRVRFVVGGIEVAADPAAWLTRLRTGGRGVRMYEIGGRRRGEMSDVAFVGRVSRWLIAEASGAGLLGWQPQWSHSPARADPDRPWLVTYHGTPYEIGALGEGAELNRAEEELGSALEPIAGFAQRIGSGYAYSFCRALDCLSGKEPSSPLQDLAPPGFLAPQAERLLAASQAAWVFGGMGSWNDEDHGEEGNSLSENLFDRLESALAAVVNSTVPPASDPVSRP